MVKVPGIGTLSIEQINIILIEAMKNAVQEFLGGEESKLVAVLTVPSSFNAT